MEQLHQRAAGAHHYQWPELWIATDRQQQFGTGCHLFLHDAAGECIRQTMRGNRRNDVQPGHFNIGGGLQSELDCLQFRLVRDAGDTAFQHDGKADHRSGRERLVECCAWDGLRHGYAVRSDELRKIAKRRHRCRQARGPLRRIGDRRDAVVVEHAAQSGKQILGGVEIRAVHFAQHRARLFGRGSRQHDRHHRLAAVQCGLCQCADASLEAGHCRDVQQRHTDIRVRRQRAQCRTGDIVGL